MGSIRNRVSYLLPHGMQRIIIVRIIVVRVVVVKDPAALNEEQEGTSWLTQQRISVTIAAEVMFL